MLTVLHPEAREGLDLPIVHLNVDLDGDLAVGLLMGRMRGIVILCGMFYSVLWTLGSYRTPPYRIYVPKLRRESDRDRF